MHGLGHPLRRQHSGKTLSFFLGFFLAWSYRIVLYVVVLYEMWCSLHEEGVGNLAPLCSANKTNYLLIDIPCPTVLSILSQTKIRFLLNGLILHEKMSIFVIMHGIKIFEIFRNPVLICSQSSHCIYWSSRTLFVTAYFFLVLGLKDKLSSSTPWCWPPCSSPPPPFFRPSIQEPRSVISVRFLLDYTIIASGLAAATL